MLQSPGKLTALSWIRQAAAHKRHGPFQHLGWTMHLDAAPAYLSQLCLQLVLHICLLSDTRIEGQVGVGELPPHLVRQGLKQVFCLLSQPDGVGPHVLRVSDVIIAELGPSFRNRDPAKVQRQAEVRWGTGELPTGLRDLCIQGILNLGVWFSDVPVHLRVNLTFTLTLPGAPTHSLNDHKYP